jgi:hypothetical protein
MKICSLPPRPFPEGEGTDRGALQNDGDMKYPVELRFEKHEDQLPFPSPPLGERVGVRGRDLAGDRSIQPDPATNTKSPTLFYKMRGFFTAIV